MVRSRRGGLRRTVVREDLFQPSAVKKSASQSVETGTLVIEDVPKDTEVEDREDGEASGADVLELREGWIDV